MSAGPPDASHRIAVAAPPSANSPCAPVPYGRLLIILAPVLALIAATAVMAIGAWLLGWYRTEMVIAAAVAGSAIVVVTMVLLYGQISQQRASHEALRNVEARVSGIVESAMDPIVTVDERQRILVFNAAAEHVFRWPRAAVLGEPLDKLLPDRFRRGHRAHIEHFGRTGSTSRRMGGRNVLMALRADGEEFPIEASISQHSDGERRLFTVILRDITERVRAESLLERSEA